MPEVPQEKLVEAYEAIESFAEMMDYDCVKMVLDSLKEYILPEKEKQRFDKVAKLLSEMNWDGIKEEIKGE